MYILVWKDYDGVYEEDDFDNEYELVQRLLELARKEFVDDHATEIISLAKGELVDFEYRRDEAEKMEKLIILGEIKVQNSFDEVEMPKRELDCPACGNAVGMLSEDVSIKVDGEYTSATMYACSECAKEFYA